MIDWFRTDSGSWPVFINFSSSLTASSFAFRVIGFRILVRINWKSFHAFSGIQTGREKVGWLDTITKSVSESECEAFAKQLLGFCLEPPRFPASALFSDTCAADKTCSMMRGWYMNAPSSVVWNLSSTICARCSNDIGSASRHHLLSNCLSFAR
jgi:hypothetical protein